ncbi:unnamed protein product [Pleuronectes platessa]|uniref:DM domain-containing protein n=1 Tax=Pleuronectes platessa TaxID=8262 RepID=A0A9N7YWQ8_PLEPL|nr:unnamed protein product [Pleuronectes platessa]
MSLSKPERKERKCPRCRFHGLTVPLKNHTRTCPFLRCDCSRCLQGRAEVRGPQPRGPRDQEQRPGPGEAPPSATSPEPAAGGALDLRCRAAGGGGREARLERSEEPPLTPTAAFNAPSCNEMLQIPPQAFFPITVLVPVPHPEPLAQYPALCYTTLWVAPVPAAGFHRGPPPVPHPLLPPAAEAGLLAFWRRYLLNPSPPPPPMNPYPPPPPMNPYPSPPPMNPYPSPPPMNPYPSPPFLPEDPELDVVGVD